MTIAERSFSERNLAELLKKENPHAYHYEGAQIPLNAINILPQPRRTFEEIEILAGDIAVKGLLEPPVVAKLNEDGCTDYLAVINRLWRTSYQIEDLVATLDTDGQKHFYILIAGERRLRALRLLQAAGYDACIKEFGPHGFYETLFDGGKIDVRLCVDMPPLEVIFRQTSENMHLRVPPHEEARFFHDLLNLIREVEPDYPISRFARKVGRSPDTIRNAVKFCELPQTIQDLVEKRSLSYGIACEIARLQSELGLGSEELRWWAMRAILTSAKVPEFRQMVTDYIFNSQNGQTEMALFTDREKEAMRRAFFREIVAKRFIQSLWERIAYWKKVIALFESGELGQENSPFSEGSPAQLYKAEIALLKEVLPHLARFIPRKAQQEAFVILSEAEGVLSQIEEDNSRIAVV